MSGTSSIRNSRGCSSAISTTACTTTWWRCSFARRRRGKRPHDAVGRIAGRGDRRPRPDSVPAFHGGGAVSSRARLLSPAAGPLRQTRRLLHRRADSAGVRYSHGRPDSPIAPRDGRTARVHGGGTGRGTRRDGRGVLRVALHPGGSGCRRAARALRGRGVRERVLRRIAGGRGGLARRGLPRTARGLDGRFCWRTGERVPEEVGQHLRACFPKPEEGRWYEARLDATRWMERIAGALEEGYALTIDYGYTRAESIRFPEGTLMGYRRHMAREDVQIGRAKS